MIEFGMTGLDHIHEDIAVGIGWKFMTAHDMKYWTDPSGHYRGGGTYNPLPNYTGSLEAIQTAVKSLTPAQFRKWKEQLEIICAEHGTDPIIASSQHRALALYKILP